MKSSPAGRAGIQAVSLFGPKMGMAALCAAAPAATKTTAMLASSVMRLKVPPPEICCANFDLPAKGRSNICLIASETKRTLDGGGFVGAEEGVDLAHRERNALLGLLPRKDAGFGIRRQHRGFHRDRIRMGGNVVRQDQHRRLTLTHEIARHGEDEIRIGAVQPRPA